MTRMRTAVLGIVAACLMAPTGANAADRPEPQWSPGGPVAVYQPPARYYTYAPSVVRYGKTTWIWTCHNDAPNQIKDHVYLTKLVDGAVVESRSVLQASAAQAWDSFHTCDPSVVRGKFRYRGAAYRYAMFYLGNDLDASAHNQVGVAFATSPEGPWTKATGPIVTFDRTDQWGVGQPSAVQYGPKPGSVLLFYTRGDTSTRAYVRQVDISDGTIVSGPDTQISTDGLTGWDGSPDWLNGFDVVFDRARGRFHVVREQHPYPKDNPWWIGPSVQVNSMPAATLLRGAGRWTPLVSIDKALTGFDRNHNAGLVRDWQGNLPSGDTMSVVFTSSCSSLPTVDDQDWSKATCDSLFSYRLWETTGPLS